MILMVVVCVYICTYEHPLILSGASGYGIYGVSSIFKQGY